MGESALVHLGLVKSRVVGNGTMALSLSTFDELQPQQIVSMKLVPTSARLQQVLCNYIAQGIILRGAATAINDTVRCQDITLFVKQIYTEWPM